MATLERAAAKWARKTAGAGAKWKERVTGAEASYCSGFASFVGHAVSQVCTNYNEGVNATSAADYAAGVQGKESKYISSLQRVT